MVDNRWSVDSVQSNFIGITFPPRFPHPSPPVSETGGALFSYTQGLNYAANI